MAVQTDADPAARTMDGSNVKVERLAVTVLKELRVPHLPYLCSAAHVLTRNVGEVLPFVNRQDFTNFTQKV